MIMELPVNDIPLDRGTQVRVKIDQAVVADYAERMSEGVVFPAITVFNDEHNGHYLGDGYHRIAAAKRAGRVSILAEVLPGTFDDALWHALKANRDHGLQRNDADKMNGARMALVRWPEKMQREIAEQIGCSPSLVSKAARDVARNTGGVPDIRGQALRSQRKREAVREMVLAGHQSIAIKKALHAHSEMIGAVRKELGLTTVDYSRRAAKERLEQLRDRARDGHSSRQMAAEFGISEEHCRALARKAGIEIPADKVLARTHRHDSNRIMAGIVMSADNLTAGVELIDFATLDRAQVSDWIRSLLKARADLGKLMKRLQQELSHGEAA